MQCSAVQCSTDCIVLFACLPTACLDQTEVDAILRAGAASATSSASSAAASSTADIDSSRFEVGKSYLVTMRDDTLGHLPQVVSPEGGFSPVGSPTRRKRPDLTCLRVQMTATGWQLTDAVIFEIGTTCVFAHFGRHFTKTCSGQTHIKHTRKSNKIPVHVHADEHDHKDRCPLTQATRDIMLALEVLPYPYYMHCLTALPYPYCMHCLTHTRTACIALPILHA